MRTIPETVVNAYRSFRSHRILYATLHVVILVWFLVPFLTAFGLFTPAYCTTPHPELVATEANESELSQDTDYVAVLAEKKSSCPRAVFEAGHSGTVSGVTVSGNESSLRLTGRGLSTVQKPKEIETNISEQLLEWGDEGEIVVESQTWKPIAGWPFFEKEYDVRFKEPVTYERGGRTATVIHGYIFDEKRINLWTLPIVGLVALNSVYQTGRWALFRIRRIR